MKVKGTNSEMVTVKELWNFETPYRFNSLCLGTLFRQSGLHLVIGGEDGIIRVYDLGNADGFKTPEISLETKGGPVQAMKIEDVTKFYHNDLIVADSCGMMTVFCNQQILCRQNITDSCLNCLQIQKEKSGNIALVLSSDSGVICGLLPSNELWRIDLNNLKLNKEPGILVSVKCLLAVNLPNEQGQKSSYILASDSGKHLYIMNQGSVVMILQTPVVITAMCHGKFVKSEKLPVNPSSNTAQTEDQVALGSETGAIYIFQNFAITEDEFANAQYPITSLSRLSVPDNDVDWLLCGGHFNSMQVYSDGKRIEKFATPDWVSSVHVADIDNDGLQEVVFGCLDNSIHAIKFGPS